MIKERLPSTGGDYALWLRVSNPVLIDAGRLEGVEMSSGWALYFGSARGPGGLKARLSRHIKPSTQKRAHWHIDYLTAAIPIQELWWLSHKKRSECRWAMIAAEIGHPVDSFGASDCRCGSHLVQFGTLSLVQRTWERLNHHSNHKLKRTVLSQEKTRWQETS